MKIDNVDISFSDILIDPQYSEVESRSTVNISSNLGFTVLNLPIISSNMPSITEYKMAIEMFNHGGMGILHRFYSVEDAVEDFKKAKENIDATGKDASKIIGVSIGIKEEDKYRFEKLYEAGARVITVDVAHANSLMARNMIDWLVRCGKDIKIIAGNVATVEGALNLVDWGADVAKVGIGGGSICRTRSQTGVGKTQLSAIMEIKKAFIERKISNPIISDGGIKTAGDICKALIFSDAVMVGAVLAGTSETPGNAYPEPGTDLTNRTYYKMYGGNASMETKVNNGQIGRFVEGETKKIPFKGHVKYLLREIDDSIRSALSYSNANNLEEYRKNVQWHIISEGGKTESKF